MSPGIDEEFLIRPEWPAPARVRALMTTRNGGTSQGPYSGRVNGGLNLGTRCGDHPEAVAANRALLRRHLPSDPIWLHQLHGQQVLAAADFSTSSSEPQADASWTDQPHVVCAIQMADCMPILFCSQDGKVVAGAHAGWRGLAGGIIEATVRAMQVAPEDLMVWLGPAIGPNAFEVGEEVRAAFMESNAKATSCFKPHGDKWLCDLEGLARQRLHALGVKQIYGGGCCTFSEPEHFYSFRRDRDTGRMAALIWIES